MVALADTGSEPSADPRAVELIERTKRRAELQAELERLRSLERKWRGRSKGLAVVGVLLFAMGAIAAVTLDEGELLFAFGVEVAIGAGVALFVASALIRRSRVQRLILETLLDDER